MKIDLFKRGMRLILVSLMVLSLALAGCDDGDDGDQGPPGPTGPPGPPGSAAIDASTAPESILGETDVTSEITGVTIASQPVVDFRVTSADGTPIVGIEDLWEDSNRFVRFTITKLVPGTNGDADQWVAYTRETTNDGSTPPDYDTGSSLVGHGDGTYSFTFNTDVAAVSGVPYEPSLTHRVAGQIGSGDIALEAQNLVHDFVPAGGEVTNMKNVAVMESCNECHDNLVFHGRRFEIEYCVNCHNQGLAQGEGDMAFMTHRIHDAGTFSVLEDGIDYSEVTYPQELVNCRKCHNVDDEATPQGDNWKTFPTINACTGCHENVNFETGEGHAAGPQENNSACAGCHTPEDIEENHVTPNATPNNPSLLPGQREIAYEIIEATVDDGTGVATVDFQITSDGDALDLTALPEDLAAPGRWPGFLLAYSLPQSSTATPADYNNLGQTAAQPISVGLDDVFADGNLTCTGGICTAVLANNPYPADAMMRAVGLQGYFQQDLDGDGDDDVSLHTQSVVVTVEGDDERRSIVSSADCAACHEIFEAHGGNRVITADGGVEICTLCHVPNLSTSGRSIDPADAADRDGDPATDDPSSATVDLGTSDTLTWPEDTNNLKDMIHGIHAADFRTTDYEFVRGRNDGIYYNWSEVTFPAEVNNCNLCHLEEAYQLPLDEDVLETTVRTTGAEDGLDATFSDVAAARDTVPNPTDWVNSPTASTCFYCHDSTLARAHMEQNGGVISDGGNVDTTDPLANDFTQREEYVADGFETCAVCHGPGKSAAVSTVHNLE